MSEAVVAVELCVLRSQREDAVSELNEIPGVRVTEVNTEPQFQVDTFIKANFLPAQVDDPFTTLIRISQVARYLSVSLCTFEG